MERVLIVFGSAARQAIGSPNEKPASGPRDIDVAHEGEFGPEEVDLVRAWAESEGLPSGLPIDAHRAGVGRYVNATRIVLPTYVGGNDRAIVLRGGDVSISWFGQNDFPARIRNAPTAEALASLLSGPSLGRLTVSAPEPREQDWDGYTQGIVALRNAIERCPAWSAPLSPEASRTRQRIERLLSPLPPELDARLRPGSPGCLPRETIVSVESEGLHAIHGEELVRWDEIRSAQIGRLVNLTPHSVEIRGGDGAFAVLPSQGSARVSTESRAAGKVAGFDAIVQTWGALSVRTNDGERWAESDDLPAFRPEVGYVVSLIVLQALRGSRDDVFAPATGPEDGAIRDGKGQVVAVRRLVSG